MFRNFFIEEDGVKHHYPTAENDRTRYQAIHYTIRLTAERLKLPEYARFDGLRCEIQIQTILNHASSVTSHDILYKSNRSEGFGAAAMDRLQKRINRIMDEYLLPAGYQFQRVQQDYERLKRGKSLFDSDAISCLYAAKDNNERCQILSILKEYTLPNYDDLGSVYHDLRESLLAAVTAARTTSQVPVNTPFGDLSGHTAENVIGLVIHIFDYLRYLDVNATLTALMLIYRNEPEAKLRKRISEVVKRLAEYNLVTWQKVGPGVQYALVTHLSEQSADLIDDVLDLALIVWNEALVPELRGTEWRGDQVIISTGAVIATSGVRELRELALEGLFKVFDRSSNNDIKQKILSTLGEASRLPISGDYSKELVNLTFDNTKHIVELIIERIYSLSYEMKQDLEERLLFEYRTCISLISRGAYKSDSNQTAAALAKKIIEFRDLINQDQTYVRFKILVGYKSVFLDDWDQESVDYATKDAFRQEQAKHYIEEITPETQEYWLKFLERCAETDSNDLATFPIMSQFLIELSRAKPRVAEYFISHASPALIGFLPAFLDGLLNSNDQEIYNQVIDRIIKSGAHLQGLMRHWRLSRPNNPDKLIQIIDLALEIHDTTTIGECAVFALENAGTEVVPATEFFFRPAMTHLNKIGNSQWIAAIRFPLTLKVNFNVFQDGEVLLLLDNMSQCRKINYAEERLLDQIARHNLEQVWDFFGRRLDRERSATNVDEFEAVPYSLNALTDSLSVDPHMAIMKALVWYVNDSDLFQFRGGRLLRRVFLKCSDALARELSQLVLTGGSDEAEFALQILTDYSGEPAAQAVLKDIVFRHAGDPKILAGVRRAYDHTGAVWGKYGFVEALQNKKSGMTEWLSDCRNKVKTFAQSHIEELNKKIAYEQQRADQRAEMVRHLFDDDREDNNS